MPCSPSWSYEIKSFVQKKGKAVSQLLTILPYFSITISILPSIEIIPPTGREPSTEMLELELERTGLSKDKCHLLDKKSSAKPKLVIKTERGIGGGLIGAISGSKTETKIAWAGLIRSDQVVMSSHVVVIDPHWGKPLQATWKLGAKERKAGHEHGLDPTLFNDPGRTRQ